MIALAGLRRQPWFWPAAASALLMVMIGALSPEFGYSIVTANLTAASFLALVAIGQMFPIASGEGGIDLSIPFVMNFCAFLAVQLITPDPWSIPLVLLLGIGFGIAVGLVNGIVVVWIRVPPIIRTLAVGFIVLTLVQADLRQRRHHLCRPHPYQCHALTAFRPANTSLRAACGRGARHARDLAHRLRAGPARGRAEPEGRAPFRHRRRSHRARGVHDQRPPRGVDRSTPRSLGGQRRSRARQPLSSGQRGRGSVGR